MYLLSLGFVVLEGRRLRLLQNGVSVALNCFFFFLSLSFKSERLMIIQILQTVKYTEYCKVIQGKYRIATYKK